MKSELTFHLVPLDSIDLEQGKRMFQLMCENYNEVVETNFFNDLENKQWIGLIKDGNATIQGFTTFVINPNGVGGASYHIIFSGDTVIAPEYWGSQVMMQGWCRSVGRFIGGDQSKRWYWYLLSKGHRTYMYLPLFFENYFPSMVPTPLDNELQDVATVISAKVFGYYWQQDEGVIRFDQSRGELKPNLIEATFQKKGSSIVQFFLQKNPNFYKGEELVCTALIHPDKMLRSARTLVLEGMENPIALQNIKN
jgi:hypothetical protein